MKVFNIKETNLLQDMNIKIKNKKNTISDNYSECNDHLIIKDIKVTNENLQLYIPYDLPLHKCVLTISNILHYNGDHHPHIILKGFSDYTRKVTNQSISCKKISVLYKKKRFIK